jgi:hypothetical protein
MVIQIDQNRSDHHYGPPEAALPSVAVAQGQQRMNN